MERLEKLIASLPELAVPERLQKKILLSIAEAQESTMRFYRRIFEAVSLLSGIAVIPVLVYAFRGIAASTFASYLSLLFTDSGAALLHWKEFMLSLVESAPLLDLTFVFAAVFIFLASLKALAPYIKSHAPYRTA